MRGCRGDVPGIMGILLRVGSSGCGSSVANVPGGDVASIKYWLAFVGVASLSIAQYPWIFSGLERSHPSATGRRIVPLPWHTTEGRKRRPSPGSRSCKKTFSGEGLLAMVALNILQGKPFTSVDMMRGHSMRLS
jgi:hypothetical protein